MKLLIGFPYLHHQGERMFRKIHDICGKKAEYNELYDADYCPYCNMWIDKKCPNIDCGYCKDRPKTPDGNRENNDYGG